MSHMSLEEYFYKYGKITCPVHFECYSEALHGHIKVHSLSETINMIVLAQPVAWEVELSRKNA